MASIRYALLTLLAREPLSGYDIKQQMNMCIGPFWKVGSNQVYPELARLEEEGLVRLRGIEQNTHRPARKLYEITEAGRDALILWTMEPAGLETIRDEFLLKVYNSWLIAPSQMIAQFADMKKKHEERLAAYLQAAAGMRSRQASAEKTAPHSASLPVIEFGIEYERLYIQWCEQMIAKLAAEGEEHQTGSLAK